MAEKRKPSMVLLLRFPGIRNKNVKIELFGSELWKRGPKNKYRIRVDGRWFGGKAAFYYKYEVRDIIWRSVVQYV